eukprot:gene42267-52408_t
MALGQLPGDGVDRATMRRTLDAVLEHWDWATKIWGWDYPMIAMTAARLGATEQAVNVLLKSDGPNNGYTRAGHNPNKGLPSSGWDGAPACAAATCAAPGFPAEGWTVRAEAVLLLSFAFGLAAVPAAAQAPQLAQAMPATVERWGSTEITLPGPSTGNPFMEVDFSATFSQGARKFAVPGFYDGGGQYKVRFMPDAVGVWQYESHSNRPELRGHTGQITVVAPSAGNHGPVRVHNTRHFAYADGTPYWQVGTTSYAWAHQTDALEQQTLKTLAGAPFNKLRMAVFPNHDDKSEAPRFPFAGRPPKGWDFTRFNPVFFRHLELRVGQLRDIGVEADLILFHPYDKGYWGFDRMPADVNERYLRYVVARLSSYRNVWWSMANEFDFLKEKSMPEWDSYFQIVQASDPYQHLRSIHNAFVFYNHTKPWVTHVSVQSGAITEDYERAVLLRDVYNKPVVYDEVKYEGNFSRRWGQLKPEEMVLRFWMGAIAGTYVGHSESYEDPNGMMWLAKGGVFRGTSPPRLAFFRKILSESPAEGL